MKKFIHEMLTGRSNKVSGLIAFAIVGMIVLGCTCNKQFGSLNQEPTNTGTSSSPTIPTTTSTPTTTASGDVPSDAELQSLVKETTMDFADAVEAGNFVGFMPKTSKDFQSQFTSAKLNEVFVTFIDKKDVIVPVLNKVSSTSAVFSPAPAIRTERGIKVLSASGLFPTSPYKVNFEYEYEQQGGEWKLLTIKVKM